MKLDEAIERYTSNAEYERTHGNLQGYLEFRQLAEWLKELKQLREQTPCEYKPLVINKLKDEDIQKLLREFKNQQVLAVNNGHFPSVTIIKSCDNAISRKDMLDAIGHGTTYTSEELQKIINGLPYAKAERIEK